MVTTGTQSAGGGIGGDRPLQVGSWGLARSARAEAQITLQCLDATTHEAALSAFQFASRSLSSDEVEIVSNGLWARVSRLRKATATFDGLVRLHFHAR
eukprot:4727295-Prymnesium_polylepis.1